MSDAGGGEALGVRAFARFVGRSPSLVAKWLSQGRIPRLADGRIPVQAALLALESVETTRGWSADAVGARPSLSGAVDDGAEGRPDPEPEPVPGQGLKAELVRAKIRGQELSNELRALQLEEERRALVRVEEAAAIVGKACAAVRAELYAIPPRVATLVAGMDDARAVEGVLVDAIDLALERFQDVQLAAPPGPPGPPTDEGPDAG